MWGSIKKQYNLYLSSDRTFVRRLRVILGFTPKNVSIFKLAFYHRSNNSNGEQPMQNNERLEFLGDAMLDVVVAEYLFQKYPGADEGFLTKMRSKIVKRKTLNEIAYKMQIDVLLKEFNNTRLSHSMLGNALEALIGAIYIDKGYRNTRDYVIHQILREYLNVHRLEKVDDNFKSRLLEWGQKENVRVDFKVVSKYKQEHRDRFRITVYLDGQARGTAEDFSKKSAEQKAAKMALDELDMLKTKERSSASKVPYLG